MPETSLKVLQFTDAHIYADLGNRLGGVDTRASLVAVRDMALSLYGDCDVILVTGDLTAESEPSAYSWLIEQLSAFKAPIYCLPGNHDVASIMEPLVVAAGWQFCGAVIIADWHFVLLNSAVDDAAHGYIEACELQRLEDSLANNSSLPTLLSLHHHPVPMRSTWMDTMTLQNAVDFWSIVDKHPQVRCVLWGHVHQNYDAFRNGVRLLATPSTCVQFAARSSNFAIAPLSPGVRILSLSSRGAVTTKVVRIR